MKTKKPKVEKIDPRVARQIEILKKHYVVDTEQKVINVDFSYDTAGEIFRDNLDQQQVPMIEHELIDNVTYFFDRIPDDYQVALNYQIDDIEDYSYNDVAEAYFDEMELDHYLAYKRSKQLGIKVAIFMIVGCALLILYTVCAAFGCFDSMNGQIIGYIIDCGAGAVIFEALGILFLYKDEEMMNNQKFLERLNRVSFANKKGEKVVSCSKEEITKNWVAELKKERVGKGCFLAAGIALVVLGSITVISFLASIRNFDFKNTGILAYFIVHLICATFEIFGGIGCISRYAGKGPFEKGLVPLMFLVGASIIIDTVLMFSILTQSGGDTKSVIVTSLIALLVIVFLIVESIFLRFKSKKKKKK